MTEQTHEGPIRVLLIDDDHDDYLITRDLIQEIPGRRFTLDWVSSFQEGLDAIGAAKHEVFLVDFRLPGHTGLELMAQARMLGNQVPMILLTGQADRETDFAAMESGAADYLEKSRLDSTLLERSIRYALQQKSYEANLEKQVQRRTEELAQVNAHLREADRRKDEFLATLAHELRNPLAPIRNALEIMRIATGNAKATEQARQMMERQVIQMVRLIDDLMDVSRITRGKLRLTIEQMDLISAVRSAIETCQPLLQRTGLELRTDLPEMPMPLQGDRVRLAQVFANLLNNAAKYTEAGGIVTLSARKNNSHYEVHVCDTGVGIPEEMLPRVFDLFTQVDRTLNRSQGGLGIGLALVRKLTEMHGGYVAAHSEGVGKGAEFIVRLPLQTPVDS